MSEFKEIRNGARNDLGVFINPFYSHNLILYEVGGKRYLIQEESSNIRDEHGRISEQIYHLIWVSSAYEKDKGMGIPLPEHLLNRIREDLPKAYAAMGLKCIIDPPAEKRRSFTKDPGDGRKFKSEDGVVVYVNKGKDSVVYEWQGNRWLVPINVQGILVLDLGYKEGACGTPIDRAMRQQIHNDLIEAWGAGLFPLLKGIPDS
jgi:hypothetical protein